MAAQVSFFVDAEGKVSHGIWHREGNLIPLSRLDDTTAEEAPAA